jgi:hypothetical protein
VIFYFLLHFLYPDRILAVSVATWLCDLEQEGVLRKGHKRCDDKVSREIKLHEALLFFFKNQNKA